MTLDPASTIARPSRSCCHAVVHVRVSAILTGADVYLGTVLGNPGASTDQITLILLVISSTNIQDRLYGLSTLLEDLLRGPSPVLLDHTGGPES